MNQIPKVTEVRSKSQQVKVDYQLSGFNTSEKREGKKRGNNAYRRGETVEIRSRQILLPPAPHPASLTPLWRSSGTDWRYLCHFKELGQFGHPVEERLVDLQSFFALVLLHVKVFLCVPGKKGLF